MAYILKGFFEMSSLDEYISWYQKLSWQKAKETYTFLRQEMSKLDLDDNMSPEIKNSIRKLGAEAIDEFFRIFTSSFWTEQEIESQWKEEKEEKIKKYKKFFATAAKHALKIQVIFMTDTIAGLSLGNRKTGIVIAFPSRYGKYVPPIDMDNICPAQLKTALGNKGLAGSMQCLPMAQNGNVTPKQLKKEAEACEKSLSLLHSQIQEVENGTAKELQELKKKMDELQAEMNRRKELLEKELKEKMAGLEAEKKKMEEQIYMLRSEIYSIQCYMGTAVSFAQIRKGQNAPDDTPVVVHQKLRFLDEDLAKLVSLYTIQWGEMEDFETLLENNPQALEMFAPNKRCVTLVKLSRTGKWQGYGIDHGGRQVLSNFNYEHGDTIGILIRNGGNLYLGWTDEDYVNIQEDLILSQSSIQQENISDEKANGRLMDQERARKLLLEAVLSRHFVYNILQGIVDNSNLLPLPKGTSLNQQSELVKYAIADAWIEDTRFGSFTEILEKTQKTHKKGDKILTTQHLDPVEYGMGTSYGRRSWENVRGRGDANRTHDCRIMDCRIYPINLIEDNEIFVSVKKEGWRYNAQEYIREPRANFQVYPEEFLNLTFLNSTQLKWVLENKKLGDWRIQGQEVNYAYGVRYIKTALDYVLKRELTERSMLDEVDASICHDENWPVLLADWKLEHNVRTMTLYQAKRFAKFIKES